MFLQVSEVPASSQDTNLVTALLSSADLIYVAHVG